MTNAMYHHGTFDRPAEMLLRTGHSSLPSSHPNTYDGILSSLKEEEADVRRQPTGRGQGL